MTNKSAADAILECIERIEINLKFLSRPENLAANDGEFTGAEMAMRGLGNLGELQGLIEEAGKLQKKNAHTE